MHLFESNLATCCLMHRTAHPLWEHFMGLVKDIMYRCECIVLSVCCRMCGAVVSMACRGSHNPSADSLKTT